MSGKSVFQAAEEIQGILAGRDKAEQERILRWVNESLGISTTPSPSSAATLPATSPHAYHGDEQHSPRARIDVKTFYNSKKPKSENQVAAVLAYYLRFEAPKDERKETVTATMLDDASRKARGGVFKNALKTLDNSARLGYFDRPARGEYKLNSVGENLVAMALPDKGNGEQK